MSWLNRLGFTVLCVLISLCWVSVNGLEGSRLCADKTCQKPISVANGKTNYQPDAEGKVAFKQSSDIKVLWKGRGSIAEYWGIEVNGVQGYAPKEYIMEKRIIVKQHELTEVPSLPAVTPHNKHPTQEAEVRSMDIDAELKTTAPIGKEINVSIDKELSKIDNLNENAPPVQQRTENGGEEMVVINNSRPDENSKVKEKIDHENITDGLIPKAEVKEQRLPPTNETADSQNETIQKTELPLESAQGKESSTVKELDKDITISDSTNQPNVTTMEQRIENGDEAMRDLNKSISDENYKIMEEKDHKIMVVVPTMPKAEVEEQHVTPKAMTAENSQNETIKTNVVSPESAQGKASSTVKEMDKVVAISDSTNQPNATSMEQRIENGDEGMRDLNKSKSDENSKIKEENYHKNIVGGSTVPNGEVKEQHVTPKAMIAENSQNETIKTNEVSPESDQGKESTTVKEMDKVVAISDSTNEPNATSMEQRIENGDEGMRDLNKSKSDENSEIKEENYHKNIVGGSTVPNGEVKQQHVTPKAVIAENSQNETIKTNVVSPESAQGKESSTVKEMDKVVAISDSTNEPNATSMEQRIENGVEAMRDLNKSKSDENSKIKEENDHKIMVVVPTMPKAEVEEQHVTPNAMTAENSQNETIKTNVVSPESAQGKASSTVKEMDKVVAISDSTNQPNAPPVQQRIDSGDEAMLDVNNSKPDENSQRKETRDSPSTNNVGQNATIGESLDNHTIETSNLNRGSVIDESVISQNELVEETIVADKNTDQNTSQVFTNSSAKIVIAPHVSQTENLIKESNAFDKKSADTLMKTPHSNTVSDDATTIVEPAKPLGLNQTSSKQQSAEGQPSKYEENPERTGHENLSVGQSLNNRNEVLTENKTVEKHENSGVGNLHQPQSPNLEHVAEASYVGIANQTEGQSEEQFETQTENEKSTTDGSEEQATETYTPTQVDWPGQHYTTPPLVSSDIPHPQGARNMVEKQLTEPSEEKVAAALDAITDLPRLNTESVPIVIPSTWPQETEGLKQQQGLFATILETVNSFLSSDKKEPVTADVQDSELHRILYPEKQNDEEYCEKLPQSSCSSEDDCLVRSDPSSTSCQCDLAKMTMNSFAEDLATRILSISDIIACLAVTAASTLVFIFGYYCFCNTSREGALLAKLNLLERSLLATHKENTIIKHELIETRDKLSSIEDNSFGANEMVMALKKELEVELVEKHKAQEQAANLEKELENAAEAGLELNKIVAELLSNQTGDESIISSVEELQKQLNEQQNTIMEINANLAEKSRENSELQLMIAEQNARLTGEIASLQQDNDELEAEKSNLQTRLDEIKDAFQEDITKSLEGKNLEIQRLQVQITELKTKCDDQYRKWQTSVAKIEALEECLKSIKKDPKVNIKDVIDSVNVRAEILDMQKQRVSLKERLEAETDAKNLLEDQVKIARAEIERLKHDFNQSEKDKLEAQTRLEVLSNYFKEKETQLQKELSLKEAMWLKQQGEKTSTVDRLTSMQAEIQSLKSRNDSLRAEVDAQIAAHKAQTGTLENRAHETWLAARQSERRCEEARAEAAALRRKLTALAGGNLSEATLDVKLGTDAPSPIQLDTPESQLLGRMPPPPFLPPPFIGAAPPFMGMPPLFLPSGPIRPPPLGRLMSPPPSGSVPAHANHMRSRRYTPPDIGDSDNYYDDDEDVVPHRMSRWYSSQSPYRSHSPDSRYTRDLMSTYDTETDFSPPPSSRNRRPRGSRAGSFRAYSPQPLASSPISDDERRGKKSTANKGSTSIQQHFHDTSSDSGSASGISDAERLRTW